MSQRNPNNARNQEGAKKGVTKSASGKAKVKSAAGSSVYVASKDSKAKAARNKEKAQTKESRDKSRDQETIAKGAEAMKDYDYFRKVWIGLIVNAIIGVIVRIAAPRVMCEGGMLEGLSAYSGVTQAVGLIVGYATLIAAFVVDWRKMRPIRKAQKLVNGGSSNRGKESPKERAHREAAEAAKAAKKANKKSIFKRNK